jgi:hypothetical protein
MLRDLWLFVRTSFFSGLSHQDYEDDAYDANENEDHDAEEDTRSRSCRREHIVQGMAIETHFLEQQQISPPLSTLQQSVHPQHALPHVTWPHATVNESESADMHNHATIFQSRFMYGSLFPAYVADELLIQSFFNPSINVFIRHVLDGKSVFMLYDLPKAWRQERPSRQPKPRPRAAKDRLPSSVAAASSSPFSSSSSSSSLTLTYGTLFDKMTSSMTHALPIGLLRMPPLVSTDGKQHKPYVYTCPYAHTIVHPLDKVFVLINPTALHRMARKIQRIFRATRPTTNDTTT